MREGSPNQFSTAYFLNGPCPQVKSLFRNILPVSPCGSRFCPPPDRSNQPNSFRINILEIVTEKIWSDRSQVKSLFWNILPVNSCGSRFCGDQDRYQASKSLIMNILEKWREKNRRHPPRQALLPCPAQPPPNQGARKASPHELSARSAHRESSPTRKPLDAWPAILYHRRNKFGLQSNEGWT
jgi:hypothetical protein